MLQAVKRLLSRKIKSTFRVKTEFGFIEFDEPVGVWYSRTSKVAHPDSFGWLKKEASNKES